MALLFIPVLSTPGAFGPVHAKHVKNGRRKVNTLVMYENAEQSSFS